MTAGYEDEEEDEGSDSEPSGDNLDDDELAEWVPIEKEKQEPPKETKIIKQDKLGPKGKSAKEESKNHSA